MQIAAKYLPWPSDWEPAAQATLAAAVIAALATIGASIFTWISQTLQVRTQSRITAQFQVLNEIRQYVIKYYSPLMATASILSQYLKKALQKRDLLSEQLAFFHFCRFRKLSSDLRRNASYLLEDISAEEAALKVDGRIQVGPSRFLTEIDYSNITTLFDTMDTFVMFRRKLRRREWSPIFRRFRRWLRNPNEKAKVTEASNLAFAYGDLMTYEMNMIYEVWYGRGRVPEPAEQTLSTIRRVVAKYRR